MNTVYISPTGNDDTGDGTEANPWATLAKANTETVDGDTIIASGTHDLQTDGSFSEARIYKGYNATLIKSGTDVRTIGASNKDTVIEGFTWTGEHTGDRYSSAYTLNSGTGEIHIKNNKFIDIIGSVDTVFAASFFGPGAYNSLITTNIKITGCTIYGMTTEVNSRRGMSFIGFNQDDDYPVNLSMIGNTIYLNKTGTDRQIFIFNSGSNSTSGEAYTINFYNNIIYGIEGETHRILDSDIENFISDYNCYYGLFSGEPTYGDNDIFVDPKLIDAPNGDFRLQTNSPCLGTGNPAV